MDDRLEDDMTATANESATWRLPDLDSVYECWDGVKRTLSQLLDGVDDDLIPEDEEGFELLLWAWGC